MFRSPRPRSRNGWLSRGVWALPSGSVVSVALIGFRVLGFGRCLQTLCKVLNIDATGLASSKVTTCGTTEMILILGL